MFLRESRLTGDFISRASDMLWARDATRPDKLEANEAAVRRQQFQEERQNDNKRRKKLGLLKYDALKRELMFSTLGVGAACSGYCLLTLSVQAAISYASGVLFSCLYLQLLYSHTDMSRGRVPQIFMQKKSKKIGIRSDDLQDSFVRVLNGSAFALSSPRLVIPVAIYGLWSILHHFSDDSTDFQLVPAMFGMFAYKAAALIQVYRDNEDLKFFFLQITKRIQTLEATMHLLEL